jgi:hypothetical protein
LRSKKNPEFGLFGGSPGILGFYARLRTLMLGDRCGDGVAIGIAVVASIDRIETESGTSPNLRGEGWQPVPNLGCVVSVEAFGSRARGRRTLGEYKNGSQEEEEGR